jgi:hypothetical protein
MNVGITFPKKIIREKSYSKKNFKNFKNDFGHLTRFEA